MKSKAALTTILPALLAMLTMQAFPMQAAAEPGSKYWPVIGAVIRSFDKPEQVWSAGHRGIDIAAAAGTPVVAAAAGYVTWTGVINGVSSITVTHDDGLRTSYLPVASNVSKGQRVAAGEILGTLLAGHVEGTDCLHFGLRRGDEYLDPLAWLSSASSRRAPSIRLLPQGTKAPKNSFTGALSPAKSAWPVTGLITSPFGWRQLGTQPQFHSGVDIGVACGTPVASPWSGVVATVGHNSSLGNYVVVQHSNGVSSTFAHLSQALTVTGTRIGAHEVVALSGTTGESTGCHLHWATYRDSAAIDPISLL